MVKFTRKAMGHFVTLTEIGMHLIECIAGYNSTLNVFPSREKSIVMWYSFSPLKIEKTPTKEPETKLSQNLYNMTSQTALVMKKEKIQN